MNPKVAKAGSKFIVGAVVACVLGMIVKLEHKIDNNIDEYYADKDRKAEKDSDS